MEDTFCFYVNLLELQIAVIDIFKFNKGIFTLYMLKNISATILVLQLLQFIKYTVFGVFSCFVILFELLLYSALIVIFFLVIQFVITNVIWK